MRSLRDAASVVGIDGSISVVHDFLRFLEGVPDRDVSVRAHLGGMLGPHFKLNLIRISDEDFTGTDRENIDIAIQDVRDIYAQVGVGVNIDHLHVDREDAEGFRVITRMSRARKLLRRFRGPGRRNIDVLVVLVMQIFRDGGMVPGFSRSRRNGPMGCKDKDLAGMRGAGVGMNFAFMGFQDGGSSSKRRARTVLGMIIAHEAGHILISQRHSGDRDNLMFESTAGADDLTESQGATIRSGCAVVDG
jgi:hypothetical protein